MQLADVPQFSVPGISEERIRQERELKKHGKIKYTTIERASMCRKSTLYGGGTLFRTPCRRWPVCPECFRFRVWNNFEHLKSLMLKYPGTWRIHTYKDEDEAREVRRALYVYACYPAVDGWVIVSPEFMDGMVVPDDDGRLLVLMSFWVVTPDGRRPSSAPSNKHYDIKVEIEKPKRAKQYFTTAPIETVRQIIEKLKGQTFDTYNPDVVEYTNHTVSDIQISYELLCENYLVFGESDENSRMEDLNVHDTIFNDVRDERADEIEERPQVDEDMSWMQGFELPDS